MAALDILINLISFYVTLAIQKEVSKRCQADMKEFQEREEHFRVQLAKQAEMLLEGLCKKCCRKKEKRPEYLTEETSQVGRYSSVCACLAFGHQRLQ